MPKIHWDQHHRDIYPKTGDAKYDSLQAQIKDLENANTVGWPWMYETVNEIVEKHIFLMKMDEKRQSERKEREVIKEAWRHMDDIR